MDNDDNDEIIATWFHDHYKRIAYPYVSYLMRITFKQQQTTNLQEENVFQLFDKCKKKYRKLYLAMGLLPDT